MKVGLKHTGSTTQNQGPGPRNPLLSAHQDKSGAKGLYSLLSNPVSDTSLPHPTPPSPACFPHLLLLHNNHYKHLFHTFTAHFKLLKDRGDHSWSFCDTLFLHTVAQVQPEGPTCPARECEYNPRKERKAINSFGVEGNSVIKAVF